MDTGMRKNDTCNSTDGYQKIFPVQAVKANGAVEGLTATLILQPISWSVVSLTPWLLYGSEGSSRYPPNRRLSGPQTLGEGKTSCPSRISNHYFPVAAPRQTRQNPPLSSRGSFR